LSGGGGADLPASRLSSATLELLFADPAPSAPLGLDLFLAALQKLANVFFGAASVQVKAPVVWLEIDDPTGDKRYEHGSAELWYRDFRSAGYPLGKNGKPDTGLYWAESERPGSLRKGAWEVLRDQPPCPPNDRKVFGANGAFILYNPLPNEKSEARCRAKISAPGKTVTLKVRNFVDLAGGWNRYWQVSSAFTYRVFLVRNLPQNEKPVSMKVKVAMKVDGWLSVRGEGQLSLGGPGEPKNKAEVALWHKNTGSATRTRSYVELWLWNMKAGDVARWKTISTPTIDLGPFAPSVVHESTEVEVLLKAGRRRTEIARVVPSVSGNAAALAKRYKAVTWIDQAIFTISSANATATGAGGTP
jgi:hypothetical protein